MINFDISLESINKKKEEKAKQEALQEYRRIRTGMSMQSVSTTALNRNLKVPPQQPVQPLATPRGAATQTPQ